MEDIIKALLDVVRIQHNEADGTEVEPFNMEDIVDMAMNIIGRPDDAGEEKNLIKEIESTVENMAPDIFPPKTFDQLDDQEQVASAASMIEQSLLSGMRRQNMSMAGGAASAENGGNEDTDPIESAAQDADMLSQIDAYNRMAAGDEEPEDDFDAGEAKDLNNMIYDNIMKMMGLTEPRVEDAFDRSQIRFGKEKTMTELLEEEQANASQSTEEAARPLSAWELAQNAIDKDIEAHTKEEYVPKPMEMPNTKSASQLAAEAIAKAREESDQRSEIEKRADAMMEEARRLGKDPMQFALHQQEILRYMEKNSDELVSFEDYEDLSPEEKYEIERAIEEEKRQEEARQEEERRNAAQALDEEEIPAQDEGQKDNEAGTGATPEGPEADAGSGTEESGAAEGTMPVLSEEMLLRLSQEVIRENSDEILADNAEEDMESLNAAIMENIRKMMSGAGVPVHQESVDSLIEEVLSGGGGSEESASQPAAQPEQPASFQEDDTGEARGLEDNSGSQKSESKENEEASVQEPLSGQPAEASSTGPAPSGAMSAAELARAAQDAAGIRREEEIEETTVSAVELAKIAQEAARRLKEAEEKGETAVDLNEEDLDFDSLDFDLDGEDEDVSNTSDSADDKADEEDMESSDGESGTEKDAEAEEMSKEKTEDDNDIAELKDHPAEITEEGTDVSGDQAPSGQENMGSSDVQPEADGEMDDTGEPSDHDEEPEETGKDADIQDETGESEAEVYVLGEHTQAEIDEALRNLETLGLEGEVYERAERLLLLEMAGSEAELDAWLASRDASEPIPEASPLYDDADDLTDLDFDEMDKELDLVLDEEFAELEEEANEEAPSKAEDKSESEEEKTEIEGQAEEKAEPDGSGAEEEQEELSEAEKESAIEEDQGEDRTEEDRKKEYEQKTEEKDKKEDKASDALQDFSEGEEASEFQVSVRNPYVLKNSASFMDQFEDYIMETQENRRLSTGFHKLDTLLRYGLHKGSYFIDAEPQYLKNAFMQQIADRTAENNIDVLYISTELSRYDLMVESVSRLSYEIHNQDQTRAVSPMDIMSGREGANLIDLKDELNWYRGRISEHLFIVDQEAVQEMAESAEEESAGMILEDLIRSIVRDGAHKPVVVIDNLENVLGSQDPEDMKPLMDGMKKLASELGIPILMSYGYAQAESEVLMDEAEKDFRRSLGNMSDVYLELRYADMITEEGNRLTSDDIRDMADKGETVLLDVFIRRNRRVMRASCQIQAAPKYNWFSE